MATTTFVTGTVITKEWLQDVNTNTYSGLTGSYTPTITGAGISPGNFSNTVINTAYYSYNFVTKLITIILSINFTVATGTPSGIYLSTYPVSWGVSSGLMPCGLIINSSPEIGFVSSAVNETRLTFIRTGGGNFTGDCGVSGSFTLKSSI
jgi:hypothetical protein